jgi:hypothetical protein
LTPLILHSRVYVPEILPLHAREKGTAVGISSNWLWNFFVVMITPTLINNLAWKGYLIFMALNFAFIPLVYFCYPETSVSDTSPNTRILVID